MAITICFGLQKGGVGKTTTTAITASILARKNKVLAIDFDSQGNLTQILTQQDIYDFSGKTIYEAIKDKKVDGYIHKVHERLDIMTADDILAMLPNTLIKMYKHRKEQLTSLRKLLDQTEKDYDYILIDLPPNVGDHTLCGMAASDYAVVVTQTDPFAYNALSRYIETLQIAQDEVNPYLTLVGILTCLVSSRANLDSVIRKQVLDDYEDVVFNSVIQRKSRIKEFSLKGIIRNTKADRDALKSYESFVKELVERVKN